MLIAPLCPGEPADNAAHFVEWLSSLKGQEFANVKYAVFGCGNRDWVNTFQRIPTLVDDLFVKHGAQRLVERGVGDAGSGDFFEKFDEWEASMWQILTKVGVNYAANASRIRLTLRSLAHRRSIAPRNLHLLSDYKSRLSTQALAVLLPCGNQTRHSEQSSRTSS